ncbi:MULTISPECIES: hypothetical protein [unclassified Mycolicibacterium]|uniref:hypothetical protein n=1 Tax=unclassified Mycolicibacterium TaxID=2636767 RepID=UPI0012DCF278|nr:MULTISPECIES: hypothetical protein [unclassified Mycolicibacterium]MUL84892.1 hypothetical protein [Mycolicibacterium sp. CBMA 329]MUL90859.1 hypothetical protein [Mycolicibacterium sp. CBMA 331]MUM01807.1 hypothetical protein [Mycolicibacterium sp. CBMA 334]MUM26591.1 hypothetical protein [Mycolicibacterium sp. CBMA 295]MUM40618.1 hypothetical protein [Mycolicibacterium sp. CBMA 247]
MSAPQKLIGFVVGLVAVFAVSFGIGTVVTPRSAPAAGHDAGHDAGYTLALDGTQLRPGAAVPLRFRVVDGSGAPVTDYVESHEKLLHLIVVRRDLADYQHVHPVLDDYGTWSVPLDLAKPGDYRVFADFVPAHGRPVTLGADMTVAGKYQPQSLPAPATTAAVDGYAVTIAEVAKAGQPSDLTFSVSRDGKPVTDLQPYLGAYGHLVAVRASDLAYLHVHPMSDAADPATAPGPQIAFHTTFPSAGAYRLFLDFKHRDAVHTAEFTVEGAS